MTVYRNSFFIGDRVRWETSETHNHSAGAGIIHSIYLSTGDRVCYVVTRDEIDRDRQRSNELLEEFEMAREGVGG